MTSKTHFHGQDLESIERKKATRAHKKFQGRKYSKVGSDAKKTEQLDLLMPNDEDRKAWLLSRFRNGNFPYVYLPEIDLAGFLTDYKFKTGPGVDRLNLTVQKVEQAKNEAHAEDTQKWLVMEDFMDTDDWDTVDFPVTSAGFGEQDGNIKWTNAGGSPNESTVAFVKGTQSMELGASDSIVYDDSGLGLTWSNYYLTFYFQSANLTGELLVFFRYSLTQLQHAYNIFFDAANSEIEIAKVIAGSSTSLIKVSQTFIADQWYKVDIIGFANKINVYLDGTRIIKDFYTNDVVSGLLGFQALSDTYYVDLVTLKELIPPFAYSPHVTNQEVVYTIESSRGTIAATLDEFPFSPMMDNCVLWMDFNHIEGNKVFDKSKYQNHGTIFGGSEVQGEYGKAWHFESFDYIEIDDSDELDAFNDATWVFKVKTVDIANTRFISKYDVSNSWKIENSASDQVSATVKVSSNQVITGTKDITDGLWHIIVLVLEQQRLYLYIDNNLEDVLSFTATGDSAATDSVVRIGKDTSTDGQQMDVDFVAIFNKAIHPIDLYDFGNKYFYYTRNTRADGYWDDLIFKLNMNKGYGTAVKEESQLGATSTTQSADWTDGELNRDHKALDFEASNTDKVVFPDRNEYSFNGDIPFSAMAKIKTESATNGIIGKFENGVAFEWTLNLTNVSGDRLSLLLADDSSGDSIEEYTDAVLSAGTYYHTSGTYDGSKLATGIKLYLDGILQDTTNRDGGSYVAMENTAATLDIGLANITYMDGIIDNINLWRNRELTEAEVLWFYQNSPEIRKLDDATQFFSNRIFEPQEGMLVDTGLVQVEIMKGRPLRTWFWDNDNHNWLYCGAPNFFHTTLSVHANIVKDFEIEEMNRFYTRIRCKIEIFDLSSTDTLESNGKQLFFILEFYYGVKGYSVGLDGNIIQDGSENYLQFRFFDKSVPTSDFNADFAYISGNSLEIAELEASAQTFATHDRYALVIDEFKNCIIGVSFDVDGEVIWLSDGNTGDVNLFDSVALRWSSETAPSKMAVFFHKPEHTIITQGEDMTTGVAGSTTYSDDTSALSSRGIHGKIVTTVTTNFVCGNNPASHPSYRTDRSVVAGTYYSAMRALRDTNIDDSFYSLGSSSDYDKYQCVATAAWGTSYTYQENLVYLDTETNLIQAAGIEDGESDSFWVDFDIVLPLTNGLNMPLDGLRQLLTGMRQEVTI